MKIVRHDQPNFTKALERACQSSSLFDSTIEKRVREIIRAVQLRGNEALIQYAKKFDAVKLQANHLCVTETTAKVSMQMRSAIVQAHKNIDTFSKRAMRTAWQMKNVQGARVGEKFDPIGRVGIYIPGGTAPLISTALMTITLAKVAKCPDIVVCTPPDRSHKTLINPDLLYAIRTAGATEIYRVGGAQAIAAMALGTKTIKPVHKIFGPGNAYVVAAKRLLFGYAAIDLLPGPSEVLIIADGSANPKFIAADILAQAEHGSGHERVWLVTSSQKILEATQREVQRQLAGLQRKEFAKKTLKNNGVCVLVKNLDQAVEIANRFAPEHCEIMTKNAAIVGQKITTAGALFLGLWSPTAVGDYLAGPSHVLPTGGAGLSFPGLTVDQFQRRTSIIELSRIALEKSIPILETLATAEGLDAHVKSAKIRLGL